MFSQLPMYQRIGASAYKANLDNTIALDTLTGHPHRHFKTVHIAGTNGKGSVAHLLASIFQEAGYKTGLYTSPHLRDFRERIRVNGEMISEDSVVRFIEKYAKSFEKIKPSFFEMTFAMAMQSFKDENIDLAIVETGMGGRLDSTNIITPSLSIITNIGYDHMQFLGNTLRNIAIEKAGIIKPLIPVVLGQGKPEYLDIFTTSALINKCDFHLADSEVILETHEHSMEGITFSYLLNHTRKDGKYFCPLAGKYQTHNLKTVLCACSVLAGSFNITNEHIKSGVKNVLSNTHLKGRWQVLMRAPLIICDTAHNLDGLAEVLEQLKALSFSKYHFVIGMVNDKDVDKVLQYFPADACYYFCKPDIPRGLSETILTEKANSIGLSGRSYSSVNEALNAATLLAKPNELIYVGGSTFVVAEVV